MERKIFSAFMLALTLSLPALAHDLFLKLDSYFLPINSKVAIKIMNGSFQESEGAIAFARLKDVSVIDPSGSVSHPQEADFTKNQTTSLLNLQTGAAGTILVGLSTMPREIDLKAKDFNEYLEHDGIPDILAERKSRNELQKDTRERYSKHVKTLFQVGGMKTDSYKKILGYPVEIVPQQNPYDLKIGETLEVLCLKDGQPLANQFVMTGREDSGKLNVGSNVRTDSRGIAGVKLVGKGKWYAKFINMVATKENNLDYESKWATLTFEVK